MTFQEGKAVAKAVRRIRRKGPRSFLSAYCRARRRNVKSHGLDKVGVYRS